MKKIQFISRNKQQIIVITAMLFFFSFGVRAVNPYLPLWEHLPDGEPRVFEDPDNPGKYRAYIIGSHDVRYDSYCGPDIRAWSAPVEDLSDWRDEGSIFTYYIDGQWDVMYAPDLVEIKRKDGVKEYYLYPHSRGANREAMVAKGYSPAGPFTPVNLTADGRRTLPGSIMGFDPAVHIEYITDPNDPDYEIGFRAYGYWGFQGSNAAELDQNTMYSLRPGKQIINYFIPASSSYGVIRDPAETVYPYVYPGENLGSFNFFEAASIRKVGNKYVWIYSGYSGPDYGLGSTNSALRYAFGDTPLGPWRSGGVLVDSRAPVLNQSGAALQTSYAGHNTHGSIELINNQWYVFYHRAPRGFGYARQPMVAPITIEWDERSVAEGGRVTIRAYDPYSADNKWTAKDSQGREYTGAEVTSEGFHIYGLDPYQYYSAGYACYLSNTGSQQDSWDIWDNNMPIANVSNGNIIGYKYFGFGGLDRDKNGLKAFEGTRSGNNTKFNLFLTPKTINTFKINVWLDGPWPDNAWKGTKIGEITVPANAAQETAKFTIDVSSFVDNLDRKHAIFLVAEGGSGALFDLIGLAFSSDQKGIVRPVEPVLSILVNGEAVDMPATPVRSTNENGITGYDLYETTIKLPANGNGIPVVTASASDPNVIVAITQAESEFGTSVVQFDYKGAVKTYKVVFVPTSNLSDPVQYPIINCNPVFEGPARVAWGDVIGYLDPGTPPGSVTFSVNVPDAGTYKMSVYHSTPYGVASHFYQINGGNQIVYNYPEGDWMLSEFLQDIALNKGNNLFKITYRSGITELRWIELQRYLETAITKRMSANPLCAHIRNGALLVTGLTAGKVMSVYNTNGVLMYSKIAKSKKVNIPFNAQGVYIVRSGNESVKVVNEN